MNPQKVFETAVEKQLSGDLDGAKTAYKRLLRAYPNASEVLGNLAVITKKEGQLRAAEEMLQRAIRANPDNYSALTTLANIAIAKKDYAEAKRYNDAALRLAPEDLNAKVNEGVLLVHDNKIETAESLFNWVFLRDPGNTSALINLANCQRIRKENVEGTVTTLEAMAEREPDNGPLLMALSRAYHDIGKHIEALEAASRAGKIAPEEPDPLFAIANQLVIMGEFEEAMLYYKRCEHMRPDVYAAPASYLFALNYDDRKSPAEVFTEYRDFGRRMMQGAVVQDHSARPRIENRKIRVGYSSADLCNHVVTFFIEPILRNHDHSKFEIFAYANVMRPDNMTWQLKENFDHWIDVSRMSDEEMCQRIREDDIDILVDLAGHTQGNRLQAMAMHPAPIQATYLGYGYTTGMDAMDYFIGDPNLTPGGSEPFFSEKIVRIEAPVYAYNPTRPLVPDVQPLPALSKGYVTFGTMSRMIRLNDRMLSVWKRVLDRVPGSKLRIDQTPFSNERVRARFWARLKALGYKPEQLELGASSPHWLGYHHFDIALDCWPHNAGTTTFEALIMGVPVISKRDRISVGRLSDMVLSPMGFGDWVADTEDEFVDKAVAMASDLDRLAELRATLRTHMDHSPFCDYVARARGLEAGYVEMVRQYNEARA